jgi:hypothetical protein
MILSVKFKKVEDLIWDALVEHEINESEEVRPRLKAARDALTKEGTPLMDALKKEIKDRLWSVQLITS